METNHRTILRTNRVYLVKNVEPCVELTSFLISKNILSEDMVEEIMAEKTRSQKVGKILDILPRRGPNSFRRFVEGLVEADSGYVADELDKQLADKYRYQTNRSAEETYPEGVGLGHHPVTFIENPIEEKSFMDIQVKSVDHMEGNRINRDLESNYRMKAKLRGRALIINIGTFTKEANKSNREGTEFDGVNLSELFRKLSFEVHMVLNPTKEEIAKAIEEERTAEYHKEYDAFVFIILSHGTHGKIFSSDGKPVDINQDIVNKFNGENCPSLRGKPKMFFIQACQGEDTTRGVVRSDSVSEKGSGEQDEPDWLKKAKAEGEAANKDSQDACIERSLKNITHEQADLLIVYATAPGYKAYRYTGLGSWFMRDLIEVFTMYAHKEHVADMIVKVNKKVNARVVEKTQERQICRFESLLLRKVYLLPGYPR